MEAVELKIGNREYHGNLDLVEGPTEEEKPPYNPLKDKTNPRVEMPLEPLTPRDVLFWVNPEDRQAAVEERFDIADAYDKALTSQHLEYLRRYDSISESLGQNVAGEGAKVAPVLFREGNYLSSRPLVKPPGIGIRGGDGNGMGNATIRFRQNDDAVTMDYRGNRCTAGFFCVGVSKINGRTMKGFTQNITGLRACAHTKNRYGLVGFAFKGSHMNSRLHDIGALGRRGDTGAGIDWVHDHDYYPDPPKSIQIEYTHPRTMISQDFQVRGAQIERFRVGIGVVGALMPMLIDNRLWYCETAVVMNDCRSGVSRNVIDYRVPGHDILGTTELGVFVCGVGNDIQDVIKNAKFGIVERGLENDVIHARLNKQNAPVLTNCEIMPQTISFLKEGTMPGGTPTNRLKL